MEKERGKEFETQIAPSFSLPSLCLGFNVGLKKQKADWSLLRERFYGSDCRRLF